DGLQALSVASDGGEPGGCVGESASAKSAIARWVLGLTPQPVARIERGSIRVAGRDVTHLTEDGWGDVRGQPIAIVFQDPLSYLNPVMRVGRQIAESVERHTPDLSVNARVRELLEQVKLPSSCAVSYPHERSAGMRQHGLLCIDIARTSALLLTDAAE